MVAEIEIQKINRLSSVLEALQTNAVFTKEQLDIWAELAYFLWPDRLLTPKFLTDNDQIFSAFEESLKKKWVDEELRASILFLYAISVEFIVGINCKCFFRLFINYTLLLQLAEDALSRTIYWETQSTCEPSNLSTTRSSECTSFMRIALLSS